MTMHITLGDGWRLYSSTTPSGSHALGVVSRDGTHADTGALVLTASGIYVQCNAGALRSLPQSKVTATLASVLAGKQSATSQRPTRTTQTGQPEGECARTGEPTTGTYTGQGRAGNASSAMGRESARQPSPGEELPAVARRVTYGN